jgi:hypothetical protein
MSNKEAKPDIHHFFAFFSLFLTNDTTGHWKRPVRLRRAGGDFPEEGLLHGRIVCSSSRPGRTSRKNHIHPMRPGCVSKVFLYPFAPLFR